MSFDPTPYAKCLEDLETLLENVRKVEYYDIKMLKAIVCYLSRCDDAELIYLS